MSLATRCPTCSTAFRVVQDQLKVSSGWVRCGRCGEVFNAMEGLYDLEADTTQGAPSSPPGAALVNKLEPSWQVPGRPQAASAPTSAAPPASAARMSAAWAGAAAREQSFGDFHLDRAMAPTEPMPLRGAEARADDRPVVDRDVSEPEASIASSELTVQGLGVPAAASDAIDELKPDEIIEVSAPDELPAPAVAKTATSRAPRSRSADKVADDDASTPTPSFVQQAERAARWRRPWVRALLSLVAMALLAVLLAQWAVVQRDLLAARYPALQPWLAQLCEQAGCRIEPLRRIDQLAVDSSGLARVEGAPLYRLTMVLRNRADTPLLLPAVELSITDANGQLIARRVLDAAELGAKGSTIAAGQEASLQALLAMGERRLAGYTIELFYP